MRILTNMRVYWDQIQVAAGGDSPSKLTRLDPASATLRWRGFSAEVKPDGREPLTYDYARVSLRLAVDGVHGQLHARGRRARAC